MKKIIDIFLRSLLTGVAIAIGGTVYLSCPNKYLGAFLFGIGLFVILSFSFNLFTGKVGYAVENKPSYLGELGIISAILQEPSSPPCLLPKHAYPP